MPFSCCGLPSCLEWMILKVKALLEGNTYRVYFVSYTLIVTLVSSSLMYLILNVHGGDPEIVPSFFNVCYIAISAVTCTGLTSVNISLWCPGALAVLILAIEFGSTILCSGAPSFLRYRRLKKMLEEGSLAGDEALYLRHFRVNKAVLWLCVVYWFAAHIVGFVLLVGVMGAWWSVFHVSSGFNNAGFGLDARSFAYAELANQPYVIIVFLLLMPMGNTLIPVFQRLLVRLSIWLVSKIWNLDDPEQHNPLSNASSCAPYRCFLNLSPKEFCDAMKELLSSPQLYYTHLFSKEQTWYLLMIWTALTTVDFLMFIPAYNGPVFVTTNHEWLQALFQTVTVRTTGFSIVNLSLVQLGHIAWWMLSMYLSAYPFMISQGVATKLLLNASGEGEWAVEEEEGGWKVESMDVDPSTRPNNGFSMPSSLRAANIGDYQETVIDTVAHEIGWLFLAYILIAFIENFGLDGGTYSSPTTRILFEVSSAYGTVGLSLSSPTNPLVSFSGVLKAPSRFIIMMVMFFGKCRGLPQSINLDEAKQEVTRRQSIIERRHSVMTVRRASRMTREKVPTPPPPPFLYVDSSTECVEGTLHTNGSRRSMQEQDLGLCLLSTNENR